MARKSFIRRHRKVLSILALIFGGFPAWVQMVWALFSSEPIVPWLLAHKVSMPFGEFAISPLWALWITAPIGLVFLVLIWRQGRPASVELVAPDGDPRLEVRVSYEETTQIIDIFKAAPPVKVAVTSLGVQAGEEFRPVMERAAWFREALKEAGVNATGGAVWGTLGSVPDGTSIWWIKNHQNNDMVNRIIRAAKIKGLHPHPVDRSVSAGECEIELMIGRNPTRPS
jgi:hypothetical protein